MDDVPKYKQRYSYNPIAWIFYLRNKYCPYIKLSGWSIFFTLLIIYFTALLFVLNSIEIPWNEIDLSKLILTPWAMKGVSGIRILVFYFCVSLLIFALRELNSTGAIFTNRKERLAIRERKVLTTSAIYKSIEFVQAYKKIDENSIKEYRIHVLNLIQSNLESYFSLRHADPNNKISVSLVEHSEIPKEYAIIARDRISLDSDRRELYTIQEKDWPLYRPIDAINGLKIYVTDCLSAHYKELEGKTYQSVMAFPIAKQYRDSEGNVQTICFGAISIDFTKKYRFRGAEQDIENNLKPYYTLLLYTFGHEINHLLPPPEQGESHASYANPQ